MKRPQGRLRHAPDSSAHIAALAAYPRVLVDLGTGDGRFVQFVAGNQPAWQVLGVDASRDNLRAAMRTAPANAHYLIANALALPPTLAGVANQITINFPWGSLLRGLLDTEVGLMQQIMAIARPEAAVEICLNAGALAEAGWELDAGGEQVRRLLAWHGFRVRKPQVLDAAALRACPTTWAKRLAFGRDPRALALRAQVPKMWSLFGSTTS